MGGWGPMAKKVTRSRHGTSRFRGQTFGKPSERLAAAKAVALAEWTATNDLPKWSGPLAAPLRPGPAAPGLLMLSRTRRAQSAILRVQRMVSREIRNLGALTAPMEYGPSEKFLRQLATLLEHQLPTSTEPYMDVDLDKILIKDGKLIEAGGKNASIRSVILHKRIRVPQLPNDLTERQLIAVDFEKAIGLERDATPREMAYASLLLGNRPSLEGQQGAMTPAK